MLCCEDDLGFLILLPHLLSLRLQGCTPMLGFMQRWGPNPGLYVSGVLHQLGSINGLGFLVFGGCLGLVFVLL